MIGRRKEKLRIFSFLILDSGHNGVHLNSLCWKIYFFLMFILILNSFASLCPSWYFKFFYWKSWLYHRLVVVQKMRQCMEDSKELRTMLRMKSFGCNVYSPRLSLVFASLPPPLISRYLSTSPLFIVFGRWLWYFFQFNLYDIVWLVTKFIWDR